jgi:hypothetical protein
MNGTLQQETHASMTEFMNQCIDEIENLSDV